MLRPELLDRMSGRLFHDRRGTASSFHGKTFFVRAMGQSFLAHELQRVHAQLRASPHVEVIIAERELVSVSPHIFWSLSASCGAKARSLPRALRTAGRGRDPPRERAAVGKPGSY